MNRCNFKLMLYMLIFPALSIVTFSCIKEDLSSCKNNVTVTVLVAADSGSPDDESIINDIVLYIFDHNKQFLDTRQTKLNQAETLSYPDAGTLTIVAWCNILGESVNVTPFDSNNFLRDGLISLKKISPQNIYQIPDDILYGSEQAINNGREDEHITLYVTRIIGSMNITVRNLKKFAGFDDNNYSFIVGTTKTGIDFTGQYSGSGASYIPPSAFNTQNEFIANTFRLFPSRNDIFSVKILHDGALVDEIFTDNNGAPLQIIQNRTLNLLIDYTDLTNISVTIKTTEWGRIYQWDKIFN